MNAATTSAAQPESRKVEGAGSGLGGRRVRGIGTSPGSRTVRGAARVSSAEARHVAHVRVEDGAPGRIGEREALQWPPAGVPAAG